MTKQEFLQKCYDFRWTQGELEEDLESIIQSEQHTASLESLIERVETQSYNIETQAGEKLVIVELDDILSILRTTPCIRAKALRKRGTNEWYWTVTGKKWTTEKGPEPIYHATNFDLFDLNELIKETKLNFPSDAELIDIQILIP